MKYRQIILFACTFSLILLPFCVSPAESEDEKESYLSWSADQAVTIGKSARIKGRVGGLFDGRVVHTEHSYNYKLRVTFLTPEVIRAAARLEQINNYLSDEATRALVAEAEEAGDLVVMVEIDPREGSGIIPCDWLAILQPKNLPIGKPGSIRGINTPKLRSCRGLAGVMRRDYDYDAFWVVFPLFNEKGEALISNSVKEVEVIFRIHNKEGRVTWPIPDSIRNKLTVAP